jgi:hypothetical protein
VTRYGQRRGEFFEGYERHEDVLVGVTCSGDPCERAVEGAGDHPATDGNGSNPMIGSGMQQARKARTARCDTPGHRSVRQRKPARR